MSELRQKFEELPDIKGIIYGSDFGFNESLNQYYHPDHTNHRLNYAFIMGAWCAFQSQQAEINQLKAKNTQLTHALVNANAEKSKWRKDYWSQVERSAEYGAMLMTDPDSLEFKCYQKEKQIEELTKQLTLCREENKGLVESLNGEKALTTEALSQMRQKALILSEDCDGYKDPVQICQSEGIEMCMRFLEKALRGEHENN